MQQSSAFVLGLFLLLSAGALGMGLGSSVVKYKQLERTVSVKGLAETEVEADVVIWPIQFTRTGNDLGKLYQELERDTKLVKTFLEGEGFSAEELTTSAPVVFDRLSNQYGPAEGGFRYILTQTLSLYSTQVANARAAMVGLGELGKQGVTFKSDMYENRVEYLFTQLNAIKPAMLKEATLSARAAAQTFADDSQSKLGKIKAASQGQFSISDRDKNTPHIKTVRVVSTVVYYLND